MIRLPLQAVPAAARRLPRHRKARSGDDLGLLWDRLTSEMPGRLGTATHGSPRVLVATSLGGYDHGVGLESVLAAALSLRGAVVDILLCDEFLPACQLTKHAKISPKTLTTRGQQGLLCKSCFHAGISSYAPLRLPILRYSNFVDDHERQGAVALARGVPVEEASTWKYEGLSVGEHAVAGALRYFGRGDLGGEERADLVVQRYLEAGILTVFALRNLVRRNRYDVAVFHHGIYIPQGIIGEVCRQEGLRVVNSNPAYRDKCFIFSHGTTYHHTMITEPLAAWRDMAWAPSTRAQALQYLDGRRRGRDDWIHFNPDPTEGEVAIAGELGFSLDRPRAVLLTNVVWDAQLHYASNAFPNMLQWLFHSIDRFADMPALDLVIRVHPAEVTGAVPSRQPILDELETRYPQLPPNVYVVPPESKVSTYELTDSAMATLIYNTKTGIEVAARGKPVVVAGEAWVRGKGFTYDAGSPQEYDSLLDRLADLRLTAEQIELAQRYAYHFFFRRMIPLPFMESPSRFQLKVALKSMDQLTPGQHPGLDIICQGILEGTDFIYPAEVLDTADVRASRT